MNILVFYLLFYSRIFIAEVSESTHLSLLFRENSVLILLKAFKFLPAIIFTLLWTQASKLRYPSQQSCRGWREYLSWLPYLGKLQLYIYFFQGELSHTFTELQNGGCYKSPTVSGEIEVSSLIECMNACLQHKLTNENGRCYSFTFYPNGTCLLVRTGQSYYLKTCVEGAVTYFGRSDTYIHHQQKMKYLFNFLFCSPI